MLSESASLASRVISVPARACDTGQPALAASAQFTKGGSIDTRHLGLAHDVTLGDFEAPALRPDRDVSGCVNVGRREARLSQDQRQRHGETARVGRAQQLLGVGAGARLEP